MNGRFFVLVAFCLLSGSVTCIHEISGNVHSQTAKAEHWLPSGHSGGTTLTSPKEVSALRIEGLVAAVFTPFDDNFEVDVSIVPCQAAYLNSTGVSWIFITGTTGESVSLSVSEREKLIDAWVAIAPTYNLNLIVMVGHNCLSDARSLASYAASQGSVIKAIAAMPQSFFKAATVEALAMSMKYISDAAPNLPFYYYHIPSMDSITFSMFDFINAARSKSINFTNLVGIKYTGLYNIPSFEDVMLVLHSFNKQIEVLTGRDEMLIQGLVSGVKGMVGSQYNFAGELYNSIINEWNNNLMNNYQNCTKNEGYDSLDKLGNLQVAAIDLLKIQSNNVTTTTNGAKYLNSLITQCNTGDARYPWLSISDSDKNQIKSGLTNWCSTYSNLVSFCSNI